MRNRWPADDASPTERLAVSSASFSPLRATPSRIRLAVKTGSAMAGRCCRIQLTELSDSRLRSGSPPCLSMCLATSGSSSAKSSSWRSPRATRMRPRGWSFSSTQAFIAAIKASRVMKSIWSASTPNSRLRSASPRAMTWAPLRDGRTTSRRVTVGGFRPKTTLSNKARSRCRPGSPFSNPPGRNHSPSSLDESYRRRDVIAHHSSTGWIGKGCSSPPASRAGPGSRSPPRSRRGRLGPS